MDILEQKNITKEKLGMRGMEGYKKPRWLGLVFI